MCLLIEDRRIHLTQIIHQGSLSTPLLFLIYLFKVLPIRKGSTFCLRTTKAGTFINGKESYLIPSPKRVCFLFHFIVLKTRLERVINSLSSSGLKTNGGVDKRFRPPVRLPDPRNVSSDWTRVWKCLNSFILGRTPCPDGVCVSNSRRVL